ncbi:MAG: 2-C-methyl-D-erythritol 2,4-cyclodiphosphate synthase [Holosporales bacterium]|nr:2-C-methyl-D-erythritol 2,4-cyclodiphosphate synthase [Holosporales bacterium]
MPGIYVVIAAAGTGARCCGAIPKQFRIVAGRSVLEHAVRLFLPFPCVSGILCVIPDGFRGVYDGVLRGCGDSRLLQPIFGGASRFSSVKRGLDHLSELFTPDVVLIHDAARAFCPEPVIDRVLEAIRSPGALAVVPVIPSIDAVRISGNPTDKSQVNLVQTPQAFNFKLIHGLYNRLEEAPEFSDDASLCDAAGVRVTIVDGHKSNKKITFPEDLEMTNFRTGFGIDAHRFSTDPTRGLFLMGIRIDEHLGLEGHSDADVGIHSLVDAILGALGAGDIGVHFPSTDPTWKSADSKIFLRYCRDLLNQRCSTINNIDVTIVCETPKITNHSSSMKREVSRCLDICEDIINIKGKTTEGMGFTDHREGIVVYSIVTISG